MHGLWSLPLRIALGRSARAVICAVAVLTVDCAYATPPQRIVSLNLCTDQILIDLVPRARIAAVTHLAADATVSAAPERFANIASTHGAAEDVLAREPDLIIAGAYTTPATVDLLRRLGRRVVVVALPQTIAEVRDVITQIAAAVEEPAAGARLVAALDERIARVRAGARSGAERPTALVYQINNYAAGPGGLVDEVLQVAGFRNASDALRPFATGQTSLEQIVAAPPDVMVLATALDADVSTAADNLRHPALARLLQRVPNTILPWPLWLCGTQHIATAIEQLAAMRRALPAAHTVGKP